MEPTIRFDAWWNKLWQYRLPIAMFVVAATVLAAVVACTLAPWYLATASLLPPSGDDVGIGIAAILKNNSLPVIKLPTEVTPADVFVVELDSPRLREEMVRRFNLMRVYKRKYMVDTIKDLKKHAKFKITDAGTIAMQVEDTSPKRAAQMLNAYIELLDRFNRDVRGAHSRRTREFVEARLAETKAQLAASEQALANYQSRHKEAIVTSAISTAAEKGARLYAQRTGLEVRLGVIRGYSRPGSQEERQLEDRIAQLDQQLGTLPQEGRQLVRLLREVRMYGKIFALLTAEYEDARIHEARNGVMVDLLDAPIPPQRRDRPNRLLLTLVGTVLGLGVGVAYASFQPEELDFSAARAVVAH